MSQHAAGRWQNDDRAIVILLGAFVVAWTVFHTVVFAPIGLHPDLTEVYSWGRHPALGYFKHPPLSGWICGLWFSVFPSADWAFYLLAMVNAAAGLWFIDLMAQRYVSAGKRPIVILLLLMTPFFQFFGLKFNANAVLLSTWPLTVYCFLRAFESRALVWSAAAGAAAALAMLGKYYSIFLIAGIVIAALSHPKAARYLKSPSPWISAAVGLLLVAPHVEWLLRTGWLPLTYAYAAHPKAAFIPVAISVAGYLAGAVAYVALPVAAYWVIVRPTWPKLVETLWPRDADRRMLVTMLGAFVLLPAVAAPFLGLELTSLWTMQSWFLLPVVLLAPLDATLTRRAALGTAGAVAVFTILVVVVAAPVLSWLNFSRADKDDRGYAKSLGENVTRLWHSEIGRRLAVVIGDNSLAGSVEFYSADHPDSVPFFDPKLAPWVTPQRMESEGWAAVCNAADAGCLTQAQNLAAFNSRAVRRTIEITPKYLGYSAKPGRFIVTIVPPRALASLTAASPGRP